MQKHVYGSVSLGLYKGNITIKKRSSKNSIIRSIYAEMTDFVPFGYEEYLFLNTHPEHMKNIL